MEQPVPFGRLTEKGLLTMTVRGTKRKRFGPVTVNLASDGFARWRVTSWGLRVGPWSWNAKSGKHSVNIPGPWRWTSNGRTRR